MWLKRKLFSWIGLSQVTRAVIARGEDRCRRRGRPRLEQLEDRLVPALSSGVVLPIEIGPPSEGPAVPPPASVAFNGNSGSLAIVAGFASAAAAISTTADGGIDVAVDGQVFSSDSAAPSFDPALFGASTASLRAISLSDGGSADTLTLDNVTADGNLSVGTDGAVSVTGDLDVEGQLTIDAASLSIEGTLHASAVTLSIAGLLNVEARSSVTAGTGQNGGSITASANDFVNVGEIRADGIQGGQVAISSQDYLNAGTLSASGTDGAGGKVQVEFAQSYIDSAEALTTVSGMGGAGGQITVENSGGGLGRLFSSGQFDATGTRGGSIDLVGQNVFLIAGTLDASGSVGSGGHVSVWSNVSTDFTGSISARGNGGAGGFIEVSSHGKLTYSGQAVTGSGGSLLLDPQNLVISAAPAGVFPLLNLIEPGGNSGYFGAQIVPLTNGNIVVTDPVGNGGAVYLFNGQSGALISALTQLASNGGGATVTALTNGNYVVDSPYWNGGVGAATWGSGTTGVSGTPSAANSLVGSTVFDQVGGGNGGGGIGGITALVNGNYVVDSPNWGTDGSESDGLGAVTWGNGTTGTSGVISAANSLVGSTVHDLVGGFSSEGGVTALRNGNYVVDSTYWGSNKGAVTWGNGAIGTTGVVSAANSLVGGTGSSDSYDGDYVGFAGVTALANGNYVVDSWNWNAQEGAVTWGNGMAGVSGVVSASNSLVGSNTATLSGGEPDVVGSGGVVGLTNGNYVVVSPQWSADAGNGDEIGAVTWGNGATGINGPVSTANSLVGANDADQIGAAPGGGVTALTNGNYVVSSSFWDNGLGAVTWENGTAAATGTVNASNSLVGSSVGDDGPVVGGDGSVTALTNGNYVVDSPNWNNFMGAVTWVNGTTGTTIDGQNTIDAQNSLVGSFVDDQIGGGSTNPNGVGSGVGGVFALSNGNYVVDSPEWYAATGAVTWANGTTGISGTVSAANSLVGDASGDQVGGSSDSTGDFTALTNGNYVVLSPNEGTATWCNGTTETTGTLSSVPSLEGVSGAVVEINTLPNGNYIVSVNDGYGAESATWVNGANGATLDGQNTIDAQNSITGAGAQPIGSGDSFVVSSDALAGLGLPGATISTADPNLLTYAFGQGQTITVTPDFLTQTLDSGTNVTLQASNDITVNSPIIETPTGTPGSLTLSAGRSILLNASIDTAGGNLTLIANDSQADGVVDGDREPGNATITMVSGVTLNTGGGALSVDLRDSTDKTNNGSGVVTLLGLTGASTELSSASTLGISLDGTTPGDGVASGSYTQVNVQGPIDLNGASLSISHDAATPAGSTFVIVQASGGVSGTFNGLSEGATVAASNGSEFTISYQGDGGQDVVLTQVGSPVPPAVTTEPSSQTVTAGNQATFTAAASGTPAPTVQWQVSTNGGKTFSNIPGAASASLSFSAQPGQNGNEYLAVFTNQLGTTKTQVVSLTVHTPPTIITNPTSQTVNAGQKATFTAAATANPTATVQWQISSDGGQKFSNIAGATSTTLTITAQAGQNADEYRAVFTNSFGTATTASATLSVNIAPTVTNQPANQTVAVNQTATLSATANGYPTPSVQWQEKPKGATGFSNLAGAASSTLTLPLVATTDSGNQYRAVFTNVLGTVTTKSVTLTVDVPPTIAKQPKAQQLNAGQKATFTASAIGTASPSVQWQVSTNGGNSFVNVPGATSTTLTFTAQGSENGNLYQAVFTNAVGHVTTNAVALTVDFAPRITTQPASQTVAVNATATFTATVVGNPAPSVQWQEKAVGATKFTNLAGQNALTLSLPSVALSASGDQYRAVFTNTLGTVASNVVTLSVEAPPAITTQPENEEVQAGQNVTFTAAASGTNLKVQWQVSVDGGNTFSNLAGATSAKLTFKAAAGKNGYRYRAVFTNAVGQAISDDAVLTIG